MGLGGIGIWQLLIILLIVFMLLEPRSSEISDRTSVVH